MNWRINSIEDYHHAYEQSMNDPELFWAEIAKTFTWKKEWSKVCSGSLKEADVKWFEGGKLNITENCLDRHLKTTLIKTRLFLSQILQMSQSLD